mgnify:CR=1 FL=1
MSSLTTKKAIAYSLKELLVEKPLSKITVNDITLKCDINRQTFYYHFQDIIDLVEWICIEDADKALKDKDTYENWVDGFLSIFKLLEADKIFITNIYKSVSLELLQKYLYKLVYPIIYSVVDEKTKNKPVREDDKKFISNFYMYSFVAIVLEWVKNDMKDDPKQIVERVSSIVKGTIDQAISNLK